MEKISVIVPIYNVEKYLPQCLDSIIHQTYGNLEIILVNDGSIDSSREICFKYRSADTRVVLIDKSNGGLSDARNMGCSIATGDYISFVDSDDVLNLHFYEMLYNNLSATGADIIECGIRQFKNDCELRQLTATPCTVEIFNTQQALEQLMNGFLKQVVWNKIYKREVIYTILFPVGRLNEDEFWTYQVFGNAAKIVKISNELYFYRQQTDSLMGKKYSLKRLDGLEAVKERILFMKEKFPTLENLAIKTFCFESFSHYRKLCEHPDIDPQKTFRKKIALGITKFNKFSIYRSWDLKTIFWFQLFVFMPAIYIKCMKYNDLRVQNFK